MSLKHALYWLHLILVIVGVVKGEPLPRAFRESENLSERERQALTNRSRSGDSTAALTLGRYWLIRGNPMYAERFFHIAAQHGSRIAQDAQVSLYVAPSGMFRPEKALNLRREFAKKYRYRATLSDEKWAYQCSLEYRFSERPETVRRRRILLEMAKSLGSKEASEELMDFKRYQRNSVGIHRSNVKPIRNEAPK